MCGSFHPPSGPTENGGRGPAFYRRVLESLPDAFFTVDQEWRITFAPPRARELFLGDHGDPTGESLAALLSNEARSEIESHGQLAIEHGRPVQFEVFLPSKSAWWEFNVYPCDDELLFFVRDLTLDRAAEARLRMLESVVTHAYDSVVVTEGHPIDPPGPRIIYVNDAFTRTTGYSSDEVIGKSPRMFQGPDTDPAARAKIRHALEQGERVQVELLNYKKDGTPFYVEMSIAQVYGPEGDVLYLTSVQRDTTEQRAAQETSLRLAREEAALAQARHARQEIETILESITDAFVALDRQGTVIYVNGRAATNMNKSRDEVIGRLVWDIFPQIKETSLFEAYTQAQSTMQPVHLEYYFAPANAWWDVHFYPTSTGMTCYVHDITDRKRAEGTRQFIVEISDSLAGALEHEEILADVVNLPVPACADCCIVDLVEGGAVIGIEGVHKNPAKMSIVEGLFQYPPSTWEAARARPGDKALLVAEITDSWIAKASRDERHMELLHALAPRSMISVPLRARGRTFGAMLLFKCESRHHYDAKDLVMAEDLASRAAMAIDNARLYQDVIRAINSRDEVMRVVAHDLRNPLTTISLNLGVLADVLSSKDVPREEGLGPLKAIQRSVERASRLIGDLVDVAAMERNHLSLDMKREDPLSIVQEAVDLHRPVANAKQIELRAELPTRMPRICLDRDRILQVFINILENALKFAPPGGYVAVRAEETATAVQFAICDTGPGISREQHQSLFKPFWQAKPATRVGMGLGLTIAKGIVDAHQGRIWVESELGRGSTFFIALPRQ